MIERSEVGKGLKLVLECASGDVQLRSKESSAHLSRKARGKSKSFEV